MRRAVLVGPPADAGVRANPFLTAFEAPPAGQAFQVRDVRVTDGLRADDRYSVRWGLAGDESAVDHYEVFLIRTRPENSAPGNADPLYGDPYLLNNHVPAGIRAITATPTGLAASPFDPLLTVRPLVRAVPVDAAHNPANERLRPGPAGVPARSHAASINPECSILERPH